MNLALRDFAAIGPIILVFTASLVVLMMDLFLGEHRDRKRPQTLGEGLPGTRPLPRPERHVAVNQLAHGASLVHLLFKLFGENVALLELLEDPAATSLQLLLPPLFLYQLIEAVRLESCGQLLVIPHDVGNAVATVEQLQNLGGLAGAQMILGRNFLEGFFRHNRQLRGPSARQGASRRRMGRATHKE